METMRQSPYETYSDYQKRIHCENASILGHGIGLKPQCVSGKKEYVCTIKYNECPYLEPWEAETLTLCKQCRDSLEHDARKWKYRFSSRKL